jgi:predicted RND superfamily exporter protein
LLQGTNLRFRFGGDLPEAMEVVRSVVGNQLRSIGWTLLGIMALLLLTLRSLKRVLVLILPVVCADAILLGALGLLDVPIGIATSLFASLTIGVGVDYAIHLDHAFRSRLARGVAFEEAAAGSLSSAGRAIRWNALTLGVGFLVLAFSTIPPNRALGLLLAASMIVSWAATIVLVPRFFRRADS